MRREFLAIIEPAIVACGVPVKRRRPGLKLDIAGRDLRVWVGYYGDQRWWRLTCGFGSEQPGFEQMIVTTHELTMLASEIDEHTGQHLVELLRNPRGYQWPLFTWYKTYPGYAWSRAGWDAYQAALREDQERAEKGAR
jgi:hypothetical protein